MSSNSNMSVDSRSTDIVHGIANMSLDSRSTGIVRGITLIRDLSVYELAISLNLITSRVSGQEVFGMHRSKEKLFEDIKNLYPGREKIFDSTYNSLTSFIQNFNPDIHLGSMFKDASSRAELLSLIIKNNSIVIFQKAMQKSDFRFSNLIYNNFNELFKPNVDLPFTSEFFHPFMSLISLNTDAYRKYMGSIYDKIDESFIARRILYFRSQLYPRYLEHKYSSENPSALDNDLDRLPMYALSIISNNLIRTNGSGTKDEFIPIYEALKDAIKDISLQRSAVGSVANRSNHNLGVYRFQYSIRGYLSGRDKTMEYLNDMCKQFNEMKDMLELVPSTAQATI